MSDKRAIVDVSFHMIERLLLLPDGVRIVAANVDMAQDKISLLLTGESLPGECVASEGCRYKNANIRYGTTNHETTNFMKFEV